VSKEIYNRLGERYARSRPTYPKELFRWLACRAPRKELAWDCATGNGQAVRFLARCFNQVVATDYAGGQLDHAPRARNVRYCLAHAERTPLPRASVGLVTVAQAVHWFDLDRFYTEVRRVLRPGGSIAVWCYRLPIVDIPVDRVVEGIYHSPLLSGFWPTCRHHVDSGYAKLPFPFREKRSPRFEMVKRWSLARFVEYLGTWPAVDGYLQSGADKAPLEAMFQMLAEAWGPADAEKVIRWQLHLRFGTIRRHGWLAVPPPTPADPRTGCTTNHRDPVSP
jgi:SAM-dependent methyltransferase